MLKPRSLMVQFKLNGSIRTVTGIKSSVRDFFSGSSQVQVNVIDATKPKPKKVVYKKKPCHIGELP